MLCNAEENNLFKFEIRCPCCKRKLMILNLSNYSEPRVIILRKSELGSHNTETRCHICKSFVAVDLKK